MAQLVETRGGRFVQRWTVLGEWGLSARPGTRDATLSRRFSTTGTGRTSHSIHGTNAPSSFIAGDNTENVYAGPSMKSVPKGYMLVVGASVRHR